MKKGKILLGLLVGILPFILSGCGNNNTTQVLSCVHYEKAQVGDVESGLSFTYDKKKNIWTSGSFSVAYIIEDKVIMETFKDVNVCANFEQEREPYYGDCTIISESNRVGASVEMNLDELEKNSADSNIPFKKDSKPEELKKKFEADGYVCTYK